MANFLRMIRQGRWLKHPAWDWLGKDDIHSDALIDLQTTGNALSVFKVESDDDINRIVVALAANRTEVKNLDYVVFDDVALVSSDISFAQKEGDTPDDAVNQLHHDVYNLTAFKLAKIAQAVSLCEMQRVPQKTLKTQLQQGVAGHQLDPQKMNERLLSKIG